MGKNEGSYTQVPNIILDDTALNIYERAILVHIVRQTIGYNKKSDGISLSQFVKATGVGVSKIKTTIIELKKKKYIKVSNQTAKHGGKSYNRYSLTLSHHMANPQPPHDQPLSHHMAIQKKIEQKKREREIFFNEDDKRAFIAYLMQGETVRNPKAYERQIRSKLHKHDQATIEMFKQWEQESDKAKVLQTFKREFIGAYFTKETDKGIIEGTIVNISINQDRYIVSINQGKQGVIHISTQELNRIKESIFPADDKK